MAELFRLVKYHNLSEKSRCIFPWYNSLIHPWLIWVWMNLPFIIRWCWKHNSGIPSYPEHPRTNFATYFHIPIKHTYTWYSWMCKWHVRFFGGCFKYIPDAPWYWNIYQHLPEQNHPVMYVNIPYMEHLGIDLTWCWFRSHQGMGHGWPWLRCDCWWWLPGRSWENQSH